MLRSIAATQKSEKFEGTTQILISVTEQRNENATTLIILQFHFIVILYFYHHMHPKDDGRLCFHKSLSVNRGVPPSFPMGGTSHAS